MGHQKKIEVTGLPIASTALDAWHDEFFHEILMDHLEHRKQYYLHKNSAEIWLDVTLNYDTSHSTLAPQAQCHHPPNSQLSSLGRYLDKFPVYVMLWIVG